MEALPIAAAMLGGLDVSASVILNFSGNFERTVVQYDCGQSEPLSVDYINAAPNFLAIVPVAEEPEPLVFASVVSASGVRYAAGHWVWWTTGVDASLYDVTLGEDAEPVLTCSEINNTP